MTTLHVRLAELADDAPPGGPDANLWDRGRHLHRRRQVGTAVIAAVMLVAVGALGFFDWTRSQPEPAPADGAAALPDRIWAPSRWLPGTEEAGELGQLAAVQYAERGGWGGTRSGVVGISATTGDYRFLDLPDASHAGVALAPDGRHVAYWFTGDTRLSPNTQSGPVVGIAVYDTTTGEVVRHPADTDHGLLVKSLVWADADRLVFGHLQYMAGDGGDDMLQGSGNDDSGLLVWEPGAEADPVRLTGLDGEVEDSTGYGQLLVDGDEGMTWVDLDDPGAMVRFPRPNAMAMYTMAADTEGTRVAAVLRNSNPNKLSVVRFDADGTSRRGVPDSGRTFAAWAWLDDEHVAAVRRVGSGYDRAALMQVDIRTGESAEILRFPPNTYGTQTQVATDLLGEPTATRSAPPRPLDPRVVAGAEVAVVLLGLGVLIVWRRRVRA